MFEKIKILKGLPFIFADSKHGRKALETFLWLKHYYPNGAIWKYSRNVYTIAEKCQISTRTFWTRLGVMIKFKFVKTKNGNLFLSSWSSIMETYKITEKDFYFIKKNKLTTNEFENLRLEHILEVKALMEKKKQMKQAFKYKLDRYYDLRQVINDIVGVSELDQLIEALQERQILNFIIKWQNKKDEYINLLNPFFDLNVQSLATLINGRKSRSSGTYSKKKWLKFKLVRIEKRLVWSDNRSRATNLGGHFYSRNKKRTCVQMPDEITIFI